MEGPLGAWIRKVVINSILQHLRKRRIVIADTEIGELGNRDAESEDIPGNLDAEILTRYIQSLPDGYRLVFNMYVLEGFTHQEIADTLGISVGTSKSQLSKARASLRAKVAVLYRHEKI
jgi:RNA polymerase sigma-70 factor (ECF subfamily)